MGEATSLIVIVPPLIDYITQSVGNATVLVVLATPLVDAVTDLMGFYVLLVDGTKKPMRLMTRLTDFAIFPISVAVKSVRKRAVLTVSCPALRRNGVLAVRKGAGTTVGTAVAFSGTMIHYKISFAFAKLPDMSLTAFVRSVIQEMTDNPNFPTPCVPLPEISSALEKFTNDLVATHDGGRLSTAIKNASRQELIRLLRKQAPYVQSLTGTDLAQMLSSGFSAASTNRARMLLPKAEIRGIKSLQSTMLSIAVQPVQSARGYEARYKTENGEFITAPFSTSSRSLLLQNLVPGVVYTIQARAVGGLRGCGEWSDPVARMAT